MDDGIWPGHTVGTNVQKRNHSCLVNNTTEECTQRPVNVTEYIKVAVLLQLQGTFEQVFNGR